LPFYPFQVLNATGPDGQPRCKVYWDSHFWLNFRQRRIPIERINQPFPVAIGDTIWLQLETTTYVNAPSVIRATIRWGDRNAADGGGNPAWTNPPNPIITTTISGIPRQNYFMAHIADVVDAAVDKREGMIIGTTGIKIVQNGVRTHLRSTIQAVDGLGCVVPEATFTADLPANIQQPASP